MNLKSLAKPLGIAIATLIAVQTFQANAQNLPFYWSYMGESMGKDLYLDVSMYSLRLYDRGETLFTYKIGDEMVYAKSHCRTWQWYILGRSLASNTSIVPPSAIDNGNLYSVYDPATDEMMMRVCTAASLMSVPTVNSTEKSE
ncbi:MAG: hypothetical protein SWJ54_06605 [Cyanobacteriota bacterium]|nr:hypothetical protein [Cyanobacteriota bacterium]